MILLMGFTIGLMLWANTQDPIPTGLLIFLIATTGCDHRRNSGSTCRTHERD